MKFPLFVYPTTIACIDDDPLFLKAISRLFAGQYQIQTFQSARESYDFLMSYQSLLPKPNAVRGCSEAEEYELINHMPADLDFSALKELRKDPKRYAEISVLLIDYNMPFMNGIDLCRSLQDLPVKKLLLTGDAGHCEAVSAFNEGIIDAFVHKDDPKLVKALVLNLQRLINEYFCQKSHHLKAHLELEHPLPISGLTFIQFFRNWCDQHHIQEHYIIDKLGNLLLIDDKENAYYFVVYTDRTLNDFIAQYDDDLNVETFLQLVKRREKIPFFGEGTEGWQLEPKDWPSCFYSPQTITGLETYYWALSLGRPQNPSIQTSVL